MSTPLAPPPAAGLTAPRPPGPLAPADASRPGFGAGLRALFSGFGFVLGTPGVWPLALVPVTIAAALTAGLGVTAVELIGGRRAALLGASPGVAVAVVGWALEILAAVVAVAVAALVGLGLAQALSSPALNRIVRRAGAAVGAPLWPPASVLEDVGRSLLSIAVGYGFGLPLLAALFAVSFLFPPAAVVTVPLKIVVIALLIAWDLCDYPLSQRGVPIGARLSFVRRNLGAMLGFGVGLALLSLLPCALLLVLPAGVAGAARLVVRLERWEAARGG